MNLADTSIDSLYEMDWLKNAEFKDGIWHYTLTAQEKVHLERVSKDIKSYIESVTNDLKEWRERIRKQERIVGNNTVFHDHWNAENDAALLLFSYYCEFDEFFKVNAVDADGLKVETNKNVLWLIDDLRKAKSDFIALEKKHIGDAQRISKAADALLALGGYGRSYCRQSSNSSFFDGAIGGMIGAMGGELICDLFSDD